MCLCAHVHSSTKVSHGSKVFKIIVVNLGAIPTVWPNQTHTRRDPLFGCLSMFELLKDFCMCFSAFKSYQIMNCMFVGLLKTEVSTRTMICSGRNCLSYVKTKRRLR